MMTDLPPKSWQSLLGRARKAKRSLVLDMLVSLMEDPRILVSQPMMMENTTRNKTMRNRVFQSSHVVIHLGLEVILPADPMRDVVVGYWCVRKW